MDLREMVEESVTIDTKTVRLVVKDRGERKVRLNELTTAIFQESSGELDITRLRMFGWRDGWVEPLYPLYERASRGTGKMEIEQPVSEFR